RSTSASATSCPWTSRSAARPTAYTRSTSSRGTSPGLVPVPPSRSALSRGTPAARSARRRCIASSSRLARRNRPAHVGSGSWSVALVCRGQDQEVAASDHFTVVVNDLGQYSMWRAGAGLPSGWRRQSAAMTEDECLAAIDRSWLDMAPANGGAWDGAHGSVPVHEQFAEQAGRRPGAPAVIAGRTRVSYGDLEASANQLAYYLAEAGAAPEAIVGVHLERGTDVIRSILVIMKTGAGYLPLDPFLPQERLAAICAQVRPAAVITAGAGQFPVPGPLQVPLGELGDELARRPATAPAVRPAPGNICYVIHTSGSTGDPKAVAVSYGNLACSIPEIAHEYQIGPGDRVAQLASLSFDTSIEQIFVALTRGATLILPPPGTMAPSEVLRGIERKHVTVIDLTPAYWHQVLALAEPADERMRSVRLMITGGAQADAEDCGA